MDDRTITSVEEEIGAPVPRAVLDLHRVSDGAYDSGHQPVELFPGGVYFTSLQGMSDTARRRQATADQLQRDDPEVDYAYLWRPSWRLAYPTWGDEVLAVEVDDEPGRLWYVHWEDLTFTPLREDLEGFLDACLSWMRQVSPTWRGDGSVDVDWDLATDAGFPGL